MSLEQRMKDLLAEASVIAEASAAGLNEKTSSGKAGTKEPTIAGPSTYDQVRRRFSAAQSDREREEAIEWAEALIANLKRQRPRELTTRQRDYWLLVDSQGKDYRDVATEFGLRAETVWKLRSEAGYEPRKGHPKAA